MKNVEKYKNIICINIDNKKYYYDMVTLKRLTGEDLKKYLKFKEAEI